MTEEKLSLLLRPFDISSLEEGEKSFEIEATEEERKAIAARDDLIELKSLSASFKLKPEGDTISVVGQVKARMLRTCVVTLEEFEESLCEEIDVIFKEGIKDENAHHDIDEDVPEPFDGKIIDCGALALEFFEIGLDPHPRKPGAVFSLEDEQAQEEIRKKASPFSFLANIKI